MINYSEKPDLYEVLAVLALLRGYVEFDYKPLPECQAKVNKNAPSRVAAAQSTTVIAPPEKVRGFMDDAPRFTKEGNLIFTIRNMNRRCKDAQIDEETGEILGESYFADKSNKQPDGSTKIGFDKNEYQFRSFRLDVRGDGKGIQLATLKANLGGKKRLFPAVVA